MCARALLSSPAGAGLVALLLSLTPALPAEAKAWKGIDPGKASIAEVKKRLGPPSTTEKRGETTIYSYQGKEAVSGARQANFYVDAGGTVREIHVFPETPPPADAVPATYGTRYKKRFTEDFRTYYQYESEGLVVFLTPDGKSVYSVIFKAAKSEKKKAKGSGEGE